MTNIKQLIHIKQLYLRANTLSENTDDVSVIMLVQLLDFVVETFLKLVIHSFPPPTRYGPSQKGYYYKTSKLEGERYSPNMDFYRAWDEVVGILRDVENGLAISDLPLRRDMDQLHEIRNDVQHKSRLPNLNEVLKYIPLVESFLIDTYHLIFQVEFLHLSAISLITHDVVRNRISSAYEKLSSREWNGAVCEAAIALDIMLETTKTKAFSKNYEASSIGPDYLRDGTLFDLTSNSQKQANANMAKEIGRLKMHVSAIGFGMDYEEFVEIEPHLPKVERYYYDENGEFCNLPRAIVPVNYSHQLDQYVTREYTEDYAVAVVRFVEKQALELKL